MSSSHLYPPDHAIIEAVNLLGQVSTTQLNRLVFSHTSPASSGRQCRRKLQRLLDLGEIGRLNRSIGGAGSEGFTYVPAGSQSSRVEPHALDLAEFYCRVVEAQRVGAFKVLDFQTEDFIQGSRKAFDAYVYLELPDDTRRGFYVEIDRGTHKGPMTREKFRVYTNAYKHEHVEFPAVLYVVSFAPRNRVSERVGVLREVAKHQEFPELFQVCTLDEAVSVLAN